MQRIGVIGGVASGKSLVTEQLAALGAGVLDADRAGHEALRIPRVIDAVRQRWGREVLAADGSVNRKQMARVVFGNLPQADKERKYLEQLTHPVIGRLLREQAEELAASGKQVAVLDAPLLVEAGWNKLCKRVIFVDAPREVRLSRARERGWSEEDFSVREGAQESLDRKRELADVIIDNSGSPEQAQAQVEHFWRSLFG